MGRAERVCFIGQYCYVFVLCCVVGLPAFDRFCPGQVASSRVGGTTLSESLQPFMETDDIHYSCFFRRLATVNGHVSS